MKKIVILLLAIAGFFGCSNNVEFNNPAMQAKKDGQIWKAASYTANVDDNGRMRITGSFGSENLTLLVTSTNLATYQLGNTISEAVYNDGEGTLFSTNNIPNPDVSVYDPDGEVEIYELDRSSNFVSGRFNFNAFDVSGSKTINFNQGDFYRIPLNGNPVNSVCNDATQQVNSTETIFVNTGVTDPNYTAACNTYKNALLAKIDACGDPDGSLIFAANNLGDCIVDTTDPCALAVAVANSAKVAFDAVLDTEPGYPVVCNDYKTALRNQIIQCGDPSGALQATVDGLGNCAINNPDPCDIAIANADAAKTNFNSVPNTDAQYPTVCNAYKNALEDQIEKCGDPGNTIQTIIDGLGDCTISTTGPTGVISVTAGAIPLTYNDISVIQTGTFLTVSGKSGNGNTLSFNVEKDATGVDIITNFMIEIGGVGGGGTIYTPTTDATKTFTSTITTNNAISMNGTFSGTVESTTTAAPDFELSIGIIDITY